MWVSNTATTAMMVPIAQAVLGEIKEIKTHGVKRNETDEKGEVIENREQVEMNVLNEKSCSTAQITSTDELSGQVREINYMSCTQFTSETGLLDFCYIQPSDYNFTTDPFEQGWIDYKIFVVRYNYSYFRNM
jgi:hypothetical protein